jgi:O-antigen/teichoic acid export membrane protein
MESAPEQTVLGASRPRLSPILRNILSNWLGFFVSTVVAFVLSPFIVRHLGNSGYGVWVLMLSLTGYLGLLDLGVRGAVTKYVAKFHAQKADEDASRVVSAALGIFIGAGALAVSVSLSLAFFVGHFFHIPESYQLAARVVMILTGVNIAISLVSGVGGGILAGRQRFDLVNIVEIAGTGLRTFLIVIALSRGRGLIALASIQLFASLTTGLAYFSLSFWLYPQLRIRLANVDRQSFRLIFSFSTYAFLLQAFVYLIFYTDSVVIGAFMPVSFVTFFAIAGSLTNYARALISGISTTISPLASALEASNQDAELQRLFLKGARSATATILPIALSFMLRGRSFIGLWMGPAYGDLSGRVLWILALALLFAGANYVAGGTMMGISKHKFMVPAYLCEALCNLAISITLVRSKGVIGVAWGTTLPSLAMSLFFWPMYVRHVLRVPIRTYVFSAWVLPGIAAVPFAVFTYAIEKWWPARNLLTFFLQVGVVLPIVGLCDWYLCCTALERQDYSQRYIWPAFRALRWRA